MNRLPDIGQWLVHPVTGSLWEVVEVAVLAPQEPPTIHVVNRRSQASIYGYPSKFDTWETFSGGMQ